MREIDLALYEDQEFTTLHEAKKQRFQAQVGEPTAWNIKESNAFKKGFSKYANDKKIITNLRSLISYIQEYTSVNNSRPPTDKYPPELYIHRVRSWGKARGYPKALSAHLKGQQIILLFDLDIDNRNIILLHIGTHNAAGLTGRGGKGI